jgi:HEAT repeat protein
VKQLKRQHFPRVTFLAILTVCVYLTFFQTAKAQAGQIMNETSGQPVAGAFVIRNWDKVRIIPNPAGVTYSDLYTFRTSISDQHGRFQSPSRPVFIGIPLYEHLSENEPVIYKPGFQVEYLPEMTEAVTLSPLATTAALRENAYRRVESRFNDLEVAGTDENNLHFLQSWAQEKEFIESIRYRIDARPLIEDLRRSPIRIRSDAVMLQVTLCQDPRKVAFLGQWQPKHRIERDKARLALAFAAWPRRMQDLVPFLGDDLALVRQRAGNDLFFFGQPAVALLVDGYHQNPEWGPFILPLLIRLGSRDAIPILENIVYGERYATRSSLQRQILSNLDGKGSPWLAGILARIVTDLRLHDDLRQEAGRVLRDCGSTGVTDLRNALQQLPSPSARCLVLAEVGLRDESWAAWLQPYLIDPDIHVRLLAIKAMGRCGGDDAVPALAAMLQDTHPAIRMRAAEALGHMGLTTALDSLTQALSDSSPQVRTKVIWALTRLESIDVWRDRVNALLEDDAPMVRLSAAVVLGRADLLAAIAPAEVAPAEAVFQKGLKPLTVIEHPKLEIVRPQRSSDTPDRHAVWPTRVAPGVSMTMTQWSAMKGAQRSEQGAAGTDGCRSVGAVLQTLHDQNPQARGKAASTLGDCPSPEVVAALGQVLAEDPHREVRLSALLSLNKMATADAVPYVLIAMQDREADIRAMAAAVMERLPYMGKDRGRRAMVVALGDASSSVRRAAARTLIMHGDTAGLPLMIAELDQMKASRDLSRLGQLQCLEALPAVARWIEIAAGNPIEAQKERSFSPWLDLLITLDDPLSYDYLIDLLRIYPDSYGRLILNDMGLLADSRAEAFLLQALASEGILSHYAIEALGHRKSNAVAQRLTDRFIEEGKNINVLKGYFRTAFVRQGKTATEPLKGLLMNPDAKRRLDAVYFLDAIGATEALVQALHDQDPSVRLYAVNVLTRKSLASTAPDLVSMLSDPDSEIRQAASRGLLNMGIPAAEALTAQLNSPDTYLRWQAVQLLGEVAPLASEPLLVRALTDSAPEVRWHAAASLAEGKQPASDQALRNMAGDNDEGLQSCAIFALEQRKALSP